MAPELILALVEDDDGVPCPVTRESDVFSFACVCLEVRLVLSTVPPVPTIFSLLMTTLIVVVVRWPRTTYRTHTAAMTVR